MSFQESTIKTETDLSAVDFREESVNESVELVSGIEFSEDFFRRIQDGQEFGRMLSIDEAEICIAGYKQMLSLMRAYGDTFTIVPTKAIDAVWHTHILDTRSYIKDTEIIFGSLLHHNPYIGINDQEGLQIAGKLTNHLAVHHFEDTAFTQSTISDQAGCSSCGNY